MLGAAIDSPVMRMNNINRHGVPLPKMIGVTPYPLPLPKMIGVVENFSVPLSNLIGVPPLPLPNLIGVIPPRGIRFGRGRPLKCLPRAGSRASLNINI